MLSRKLLATASARTDPQHILQSTATDLAPGQQLPPAWRSAHMDLTKFMVSATSENWLYTEAWCSGSKLLRECIPAALPL